MAMILLYFLFALTILHASCLKIFVPKSVGKCPADNPMDTEFELITDNNNEMALNMKANVDYDIEESYTVSAEIYYFRNGNWELGTPYNDAWCHAANAIAQLWTVFKAAVKPPIPEGCNIPAGEYSAEGFKVKGSDVLTYIQILDEGQVKLNVYLKDDEGKSIICAILEGEVKNS